MRASRSPGAFGHLRRVGLAALIALSLGLVVVVLGQGFSTIGAVRVVEDVALGVAIAAVVVGCAAFVAVRLADWRDPQSEMEFEELVERSEELAPSSHFDLCFWPSDHHRFTPFAFFASRKASIARRIASAGRIPVSAKNL